MDVLLNFLLVCLAISTKIVVAKPVESSSVVLKYDVQSQRFSFDPYSEGDPVATAYLKNDINKTGWAYLELQTSDSGNLYPDFVQAYAAGLAEAEVTKPLVKMHWANTMAGYCTKPYSKFCSKLSAFLDQNLKWMKNQIAENRNSGQQSPFWHHVELFLYQAAGLADGLNGASNPANMNIDPMGFFMFQVGGDIEDLESVLGKSDAKRRPLGSGSCSALVKLVPEDLFVAQDTWNGYESMLRILKVYDFPWKTVKNGTDIIPGRIQSFSSYPGTLMSGDDYYLLSSGLVTMETTIGNNNSSLWQYVTPSTVLEGIRSVVANRLATTGAEWATIFSVYNSGTYNNEWMVVDYKQFNPEQFQLNPGLLTVLDQIPGHIKWADLTHVLSKQGYFPSYNVAYFPEIFSASGNQAMVDKYGDWFTYSKTPRALIFQRDHIDVYDTQSMTKLMRYNDFKHDPLSRCNCTPPYSAENAISARSDLNPKDGKYPFGALGHRLHGGVDMKLTSYEMFKDLAFIAVGGPSWDQQPPFQWSKSDFKSTSHIGQPDLWQFPPVLFNISQIFSN